tara:strand:- start:153 stop:791 length:639 start_codon:yes stop_codon:yes gene_type:complete
MSGYTLWLEQIVKLRKSMETLKSTDNNNIIEHFFTQAMENEFQNKSIAFKAVLKELLSAAVLLNSNKSPSESSALILKQIIKQAFPKFRLSDIRNYAVFNMYMRSGRTCDTYFERFSSPPGTEAQNSVYSQIAHGRAVCNAADTSKLANLLTYMQFLKRVFVVKHMLSDPEIVVKPSQLNWVGAMMVSHIKETSLSMLIWVLFIDTYNYGLV